MQNKVWILGPCSIENPDTFLTCLDEIDILMRPEHDWYMKANRMCEQNYHNLFNPNYKSFTWDDVWKK